MSWLHLHIFNFLANAGLLAAGGSWLALAGMLAGAAGIALNIGRAAT